VKNRHVKLETGLNFGKVYRKYRRYPQKSTNLAAIFTTHRSYYMRSHPSHHLLGLLAAAVITLTACGGGSGTNPAVGAIVNGVAATGQAIANGQVTLKCSTGTAAAVSTNADGSFSIDVSKLTLPCVARVAFNDSTGIAQKLHSLVRAAGTANITPVTELLLAQLSSTGVAADAFDKFDAAEVQTFDAKRLSTAAQAVKAALAAKGVDVTHLSDDPVGTRFVAAHGSTAGDDQDKVLDDIRDRLTGEQKTLHDLETEMRHGHETHDLSTSTGLAGDAVAGKAAYEANCLSCHGMRVSDAVNAANILSAIKENEGGMGFLTGTISSSIADNIATYMASVVSGNTRTAMKTQTISFAAPGIQTMGVATPALTATASSGLSVTISSTTPAVCTVTNTTLVLVAPGNCSLKATQGGSTTYNAAVPVVNTFTVASASGQVLSNQTISFASPGAQTVGSSVTLSASSNSGLTVTFTSTTPSVCAVSGTSLTLLAVGNCSITADQAGNSTYSAAASLPRTFKVNPSTPVVVAGSAINGKALYASDCASCHTATPGGNVLNGKNASVLQAAITANRGGMMALAGLTTQNLADIAAFLTTPTL
jgi:mono/diheme cytochrome c family protein